MLEALRKISDVVWELPVTHKAGMRVPARIYGTEKLLQEMDEAVIDQISNVATLPGLVKHAICMPDGHFGYGFPIGGVAAMDTEEGVISPGGIGFDINCGMRLLTTNLTAGEVEPYLKSLVDLLFARMPAGIGSRGSLSLSRTEFRRVLEEGAHWCIENEPGRPEDLARTEEHGRIGGADPSLVSEKAIDRGIRQVGTLGSGSHYLEIQAARPADVYDPELARAFGITLPNQVVIMFHCGSRGFGHQVASDYLKVFLKVMEASYGIKILDRELASARQTLRSAPSKLFHFLSDAKNVAVLRAASIDAVSLANNHTLDFGHEALLDTLSLLSVEGIAHAGAGRSFAEVSAPAMMTVGRDSSGTTSVGLLAFSDNEPRWEARSDRPGVFYVPTDPEDERAGRLLQSVGRATPSGGCASTPRRSPTCRRVGPEDPKPKRSRSP